MFDRPGLFSALHTVSLTIGKINLTEIKRKKTEIKIMFLLGRCQQIQFYNFFRSVPLQIDVYYEITLKRGFKCKNSLFCLFDSVDSDDSDDSIESVDPLRSCTTSCLTLLNGHHISGH